MNNEASDWQQVADWVCSPRHWHSTPTARAGAMCTYMPRAGKPTAVHMVWSQPHLKLPGGPCQEVWSESPCGIMSRTSVRETRMHDSTAKVRNRNPTHSANIHILDSDGHKIWIDVRVTAVPLGRPVGPALRDAERVKRDEYSLPPSPTMDVHDAIRPLVLEQFGRSGTMPLEWVPI